MRPQEPEHGYAPNEYEMEEEKTGYLALQAKSEFSRIVEQERYNQRRGKLLFLRGLGRKGRLDLCAKYAKHWRHVLGA